MYKKVSLPLGNWKASEEGGRDFIGTPGPWGPDHSRAQHNSAIWMNIQESVFLPGWRPKPGGRRQKGQPITYFLLSPSNGVGNRLLWNESGFTVLRTSL